MISNCAILPIIIRAPLVYWRPFDCLSDQCKLQAVLKRQQQQLQQEQQQQQQKQQQQQQQAWMYMEPKNSVNNKSLNPWVLDICH